MLYSKCLPFDLGLLAALALLMKMLLLSSIFPGEGDLSLLGSFLKADEPEIIDLCFIKSVGQAILSLSVISGRKKR